MKLFKKLCSQNQQRKFNALWARLDELTLKQTAEAAPNGEEPIALGPLPTDTPQIVRRSGSSIRSFSQWIRNEPNEKWVYTPSCLGRQTCTNVVQCRHPHDPFYHVLEGPSNMVRIILLNNIDQYPLLIVIKHSLGPSTQVSTQPRRLSPVRPQSGTPGTLLPNF